MTMPQLTPADTINLLTAISHRIIDDEDILASADRAVGDGDHGQGMARGFTAGLEALSGMEETELPFQILDTFGTALLASMGGASGVVFGTLFRGPRGGDATRPLNVGTLAQHLADARDEIERRGGARQGQKTMLDALIPAIESLTKEPADADFAPALRRAADAAASGAADTRQMIARFGKASTMGDRALGHPDPGALSVSFIFDAAATWALAATATANRFT